MYAIISTALTLSAIPVDVSRQERYPAPFRGAGVRARADPADLPSLRSIHCAHGLLDSSAIPAPACDKQVAGDAQIACVAAVKGMVCLICVPGAVTRPEVCDPGALQACS